MAKIVFVACLLLVNHGLRLALDPLADPNLEGGAALLSLFIVVAALNQYRRSAKEDPSVSKEPTNAEQVRLEEARGRLLEMEKIVERKQRDLEDLAAREKEAQAEVERLKTGLKEAQARISAVSLTPRSENAEAEIVGLISLLQEKGRLLDFLMDDITAYSTEQVGAAARVVHQGCSSVLKEYFDITQVYSGKEGDPITLEQGFSANQYRVVGRVQNQPPYKGKVLHRGWKTEKIKLPKLMQADSRAVLPAVLAPAEVELN
jgi:hypothetical protein